MTILYNTAGIIQFKVMFDVYVPINDNYVDMDRRNKCNNYRVEWIVHRKELGENNCSENISIGNIIANIFP